MSNLKKKEIISFVATLLAMADYKMFKIGILTDNIKEDFHSGQLFEQVSSRAQAIYLRPKDLQLEISKNLASIKCGSSERGIDALIVRRLDQNVDTDLQFDLLSQLQRSGVLTVNSCQALSITESKALTSYLLAIYGLPVIESLATQQPDEALAFTNRFDDAVIKPLYGHLGHDVYRASEAPDSKKLIDKLIQKYGSVFAQRFIETNGKDLRVFVVDDHVCAAIERQSDCGWKTNIFLGAKAKKINLCKSLRDLAVKASQIAGLDYCGLDLICENGQYYILELNGSPAWTGASEATGKDIANEIISSILKKLRNFQKTGQYIAS